MHGFRRNDPRLIVALALGLIARWRRGGPPRRLVDRVGDEPAAPGQPADDRVGRPRAGLVAIHTAAADPDAQRPGVPHQPHLRGQRQRPAQGGARRAGAVHDLGRRGHRADLHRRADQEHDRQQRAQLNASRADEATTALDLKLEVAREATWTCSARTAASPWRRATWSASRPRPATWVTLRRARPGHPQRPARRSGRPCQRPAAADPGPQPARTSPGRLTTDTSAAR